IQTVYADDLASQSREMQRLYLENKVVPWGGCASGFVDLAFIVVGLVTLSSFAPQIRLDGGRLGWVTDVTRHDGYVGVVWVVANLVSMLASGVRAQFKQAPVPVGPAWLFAGGVVLAVARYWEWPAYVFIFWLLLIVIGM